MADDHDFHQAGDFFAEAIGGVTCNLDLLKEAARDAIAPFELFSAGPASNCQQMLTRVEMALADYKTAGHKVPKHVQAEYATWARKLKVAQARDQLHAAAQAIFPGCVCLGFGGRFPKDGLTIATADGRTISDPTVETYRDPCACPVGQAAAERIATARTQLLREDQARRVRKLWADLKMPEILVSVSLDDHPDRVKIALVERWYAGDFKPGLVIGGLNQRGKSVTAFLLAKRAITDGIGVVAMTVPDLLGRLRETFSHDERFKDDPGQPVQRTHQQLIESLQTVPFLVLDDLGAEKMSDYVETALYQILDGRVNGQLRTVITTNLLKKDLAQRVGPRVYSRISHLCDRVVFEGPMIGPAQGGLLDLEDLTEIA